MNLFCRLVSGHVFKAPRTKCVVVATETSPVSSETRTAKCWISPSVTPATPSTGIQKVHLSLSYCSRVMVPPCSPCVVVVSGETFSLIQDRVTVRSLVSSLTLLLVSPFFSGWLVGWLVVFVVVIVVVAGFCCCLGCCCCCCCCFMVADCSSIVFSLNTLLQHPPPHDCSNIIICYSLNCFSDIIVMVKRHVKRGGGGGIDRSFLLSFQKVSFLRGKNIY